MQLMSEAGKLSQILGEEMAKGERTRGREMEKWTNI